jgi:ATP-dependent helicase/nuclease subunit A
MEESTRADDQGNTSFSGGGAIRMMTIHKAKGLEFPLVIVMGMGRELSRDDSYWSKRDPFKISFLPLKRDLPEDFGYGEILPYQVQANADEVKRLVYVAATRASQYLILSSGQSKPKKEEDNPKGTMPSFYELAPFEEITEDFWGKRPDQREIEKIGNSFAEVTLPEETSINDVGLKAPSLENRILKDKTVLEDVNLLDQSLSSQKMDPKSSPFPREITLVSPSASGPRHSSGPGIEGKIEELDSVNSLEDQSKEDQSLISKPIFQSPLFEGRSREESARAGVFFHRCLELGFREGNLQNLEEIWFSILGEEESQLREEYFEMVIRSFKNSKLSHLVSKADRIRTEASYGFLSGQDLVRGSMDLVLEFEDEVMVIDYKTSNVIADQVGSHALSHGYVNQLRHYMEALKVMYSGKKILGGLWYARPGQLWEIQNDT